MMGEGVISRGKQISLATELFSKLPSFPGASLDEVLSIRSDLGEPLVRFRAAMVHLSNMIKESQFDDQFEERVQDINVQEVEPALMEIREALRDNSTMRRLQQTLFQDEKTNIEPAAIKPR